MPVRSRKRLWVAVAVLIWMLPVSSVTWAQEKDGAVEKAAVVNGAVISKKDLERSVEIHKLIYARQNKTVADEQIEAEALRDLINQELLYQESQRLGIKVGKKKVDHEFQTMKDRFGSEEEFKKMLVEKDVSEAEIRLFLKRSLLIKKLVEKEVYDKIPVSDKELKAYYDEHPEFFKQPELVKVSHILINVDPQADEKKKAEARKRLEEIRDKARNGQDFAELAQKFSDDASKSRGGDLGYIHRGQTVKPFEDAAFSLEIGQISDIVESRYGYHLIKVFDKKPAVTMPYEEVKTKLRYYLKQQKSQKVLTAYIEKLRKEAEVKIFIPKESSKAPLLFQKGA